MLKTELHPYFVKIREAFPDGKIGIRGTTVSGKLHAPVKLGKPWNPNDFDLDIYIQGGNIPTGIKFPISEIRDTLVQRYPALFKGLRPGGEGLVSR